MPNPFGLHFDGDLRRIYEVPVDSSFVVDGGGYRIYTPDDIPSASKAVFMTHNYLWSRWVDYHGLEEWATLAFLKIGGALRFVDQNGIENFAPFDLRLLNDWELVPANYPHQWTIQGNVYPNAGSGTDFDTSRITSQGVSPRIAFSVEGTVVQVGVSGLTTEEAARIASLEENMIWMRQRFGGNPDIPTVYKPDSIKGGVVDITFTGDGETETTATHAATP